MQRISIVGSSGSGKTTLARTVSKRLDIPHLELDAVHHQPDWEPLPHAEFQAAVRPLVNQDSWVIDGNYHSTGVQDIIWERADTIIWLDLSRWATMRRVTGRSVRRSITREELWNGNREHWTNLIHPKPEINIVMWTWTRYEHNRQRYATNSTDPTWSHIEWVHLRSQSEIDSFVYKL
jgi:adenylate kinase family enzyme